MRNDKPKNVIVEMTFDFSVKVVEYCENLYNMNRFTMGNQIFRSGTGIGANVREAQNAESKFDFIHKMKIAAKECDEMDYWLELCNRSGVYPATNKLKNQLWDISRILDKIIASSKNSIKQNN